MFGLPTLYVKLAGAAAAALLVISTLLYISHLKGNVENLTTSLELEKGRYALLATEFDRVTQDKLALDTSLKQAEVNRQALVKSRDVLLKKSRAKVPAVETACPKVIEWAIENKSDLSWEAK